MSLFTSYSNLGALFAISRICSILAFSQRTCEAIFNLLWISSSSYGITRPRWRLSILTSSLTGKDATTGIWKVSSISFASTDAKDDGVWLRITPFIRWAVSYWRKPLKSAKSERPIPLAFTVSKIGVLVAFASAYDEASSQIPPRPS